MIAKPATLSLLILLAACKPPPTDDVEARGSLAVAPDAPSQPIDSPDTSSAIWAESSTPGRLLFGNPGEPPLLVLECIQSEKARPIARITRVATADPGAKAFMAIIGNFHILRTPVDAVDMGTRSLWQGDISLDEPNLEAFTGRREVTITVPGAGLLKIADTEPPRALIAGCRAPWEGENEGGEGEDTELSDPPDPQASEG